MGQKLFEIAFKKFYLQRLLEAFSKNFSFLLEINKFSMKPKCDNWLSLDLHEVYVKLFLYAFDFSLIWEISCDDLIENSL